MNSSAINKQKAWGRIHTMIKQMRQYQGGDLHETIEDKASGHQEKVNIEEGPVALKVECNTSLNESIIDKAADDVATHGQRENEAMLANRPELTSTLANEAN